MERLIEELQQTRDEAKQAGDLGKEIAFSPRRLIQLLDDTIQALRGCGDGRTTLNNKDDNPLRTTTNQLTAINHKLDQINNKLDAKQDNSKVRQSYAAVLRSVGAKPTGNETDAGAKTNRTLTIRIRTSEDKAKLRRHTSAELRDRIHRTSHPFSRQVIAVSKLPSEDLEVITSTVEARQGLEQETSWLKTLAEQAHIQPKSFPILVHGVRVAAVNTENQQTAIHLITAENNTLHPTLRITRATWPKTVAQHKKLFASLIVDTASAEQANDTLSKGLVIEGILHDCEIFHSRARMTQCFKCQGYGHVSKACRNQARCAHCAGHHNTKECKNSADPTKTRCAACDTQGHKAWMAICPRRAKERERAQVLRSALPNRYTEGYSPSATPAPSGGDTRSAPAARGKRRRVNDICNQEDQETRTLETPT